MTMTPTQREAALRLADNMDLPLEAWMDQAATMLRELAADPVVNQSLTTEPQSEPAAWFYRSISGAQFVHFYKNTPRFLADQDAAEQWPDAHSFTPLYTHPPQQRKPLSDEQMKEVMSAAGVRVFQPGLWDVLLDAGRAIEHAHGIIGEPT